MWWGWGCRCVCCFIQITARLCEEILGGVADGTLELHESEGVLGDALHILASKEIKLSAVRCAISCDEIVYSCAFSVHQSNPL